MSLFTTRPTAKYTIRGVEVTLYLLPAEKAKKLATDIRQYEKMASGMSEADQLKKIEEFVNVLIEYSNLSNDDVYNEKSPEYAMTYAEIFELVGALVTYSITPLAPKPRS